MKTQESSPSRGSKRSMARYDDSPRGNQDRRDRRKSPTEHRRRVRDTSADRVPPYDDYRRSMQYKVLLATNFSNKYSDTEVRDELATAFRRYGNVTVKVSQEGGERVAYLHFATYEDAKSALHTKNRMPVCDRPLQLEPLPRHRQRSQSPQPDYHHLSPPVPRRMRLEHHRLQPPPPPLPPPPPPPPVQPPLDMRPIERPFPPRFRRDETKKEKFPNYLHHVPPEDDDKATRTLFVGNLEVPITEPDLRRIFSRYGVVEDIDIKRPPPGQGNAYAFIKFVNLDMAHRAKVEMSGQYIGKFQCKIGYGKATPSTRIWVGGLGSWTSMSVLEREFDRFGLIRKIEYVKGDSHAYIQFDSIDAATSACQQMRGAPLGGADKRLRVDFAHPDPTAYAAYPGAAEPFRAPADYADPSWPGRYDDRRWEASYVSVPPPPGNWRPRSPPSPSSASVKRENGTAQSATTLQELACGRTVWQGLLVLKSNAFPARMVLCTSEPAITMLGSDQTLRITQRLRLDAGKLAEVDRRLSQGLCSILVALGRESQEASHPVLQNLVSYLKQKNAAGVITVPKGIVYAFPPCDFALKVLHRACPNIKGLDEDHILVVAAPNPDK
uniref:Putative spenito n=1 Tax=Rhipicephalus pulchellus TaxID=72859 RepID=L7LQQ5_RHIPC